MPDMCPAIISHNQFLATSFKENPYIDFIIIRFDFLYDTPEVLLKEYGEIEKKHINIQFLSSFNHYNDLVYKFYFLKNQHIHEKIKLC